MTTVIERWGARGRDIAIEVDPDALGNADAVTRRRLALQVERARARLVAIREEDSELLALVSAPSGADAWRSLDATAGAIGLGWGGTSAAPVVKGPVEARGDFEPVDVHAMLTERVRETIFEVGEELDGPALGFGQRFKAMLVGRNAALAKVFADPCTELVYSDRYIKSPLVVRLAAELLGGLSDAGTQIEVRTRAQRKGAFRSGKSKFKDDWADLAIRNLVLEHLLAGISPRARLVLDQDVPHRRRLDFVTPRGSGTIFFDQGLGSWNAVGEVGFDHRLDGADQIGEIANPFTIVNGPDGTFFAIRLD
jgi:hypothetical protein